MYCCYICHRAINSFNLNKGSTKVQILTAFLFHSLHYVALRITLTSITCLPLQGLSNCQFSMSHWGSILEFPQPSQQHKTDFLTTLLWNYPIGWLSPSSFLLVKSKAWDKVQGFWFEVFLL